MPPWEKPEPGRVHNYLTFLWERSSFCGFLPHCRTQLAWNSQYGRESQAGEPQDFHTPPPPPVYQMRPALKALCDGLPGGAGSTRPRRPKKMAVCASHSVSFSDSGCPPPISLSKAFSFQGLL